MRIPLLIFPRETRRQVDRFPGNRFVSDNYQFRLLGRSFFGPFPRETADQRPVVTVGEFPPPRKGSFSDEDLRSDPVGPE
jgi:hypothetical protein